MPVYQTTDTGAQDGFSIPLLGQWVETGDAIGTGASLTGTSVIGLRFRLHTQFDSESRPIEPALVWPSFSLTLYLSEIQDGATTCELRGTPEAAPAAWSDSNLPPPTAEILTDLDGNDLTIEIPHLTAANTAITFASVDPSSWVRHLRHSSYNGYFSLVLWATPNDVLFHSSRTANSALWPTLTTTEESFTTGMLNGDSIGRRSRMRHCPRTGMPVASDAMVRDGYTEGLMVSPEGWDPDDPEDRYVPNPNEGVVDDEV